jgi:hypothetical protein
MDLNQGLTAIQAAATYLQGILVAVKKAKEVDQQISALDFKEQLLELKEKLLEARDEANALLQENQDLCARLKLKDEMEHQEDGNIMWRIENSKRHGPYCSTCYGDAGKAITLSERDKGAWDCPRCKNHFNTRQWDLDQLEKHQSLRRSHGWPGLASPL